MGVEQLQNVLVIGGGAREHSILWKLTQSRGLGNLYVATGNAGTSQIAKNLPIEIIDIDGIRRAAHDYSIDRVIVGPERPLALGLVDGLTEDGIKSFGPTRDAARLESSKWFGYKIAKDAGVKVPHTIHFQTPWDAYSYLHTVNPLSIVIKTDGLADGKGVVLPKNQEEAFNTVYEMLVLNKFKNKESGIVIQQRLKGKEVSIQGHCDGKTFVPSIPIEDHKQLNNHDEGPNTGGMGAYGPVGDIDPQIYKNMIQSMQKIIDKMAELGTPVVGNLFCGFMITDDGEYLLETNVRYGAPETEVEKVMADYDLLEVVNACVDGKLTAEHIKYKPGAALGVVLASRTYPESFEENIPIEGLDIPLDPNVFVFHGATKMHGKQIVTAGGRVLTVVGYGKDIEEAYAKAYGAIGKGKITFLGEHHRIDIGRRAA